MKRPLFLFGAIVGGLLALFGPCWAVFGMMRTFRVLGREGVSKADELSAAIGQTLSGSAVGMIALPVGVVLCAYCIVQFLKVGKSSAALPPTPTFPPDHP